MFTGRVNLLRAAAPHSLLVIPPAATVPRRVLLTAAGQVFVLGEHAGVMRHLLSALRAELIQLQVGAARQKPTTLPRGSRCCKRA